jgi:hypothetical protein
VCLISKARHSYTRLQVFRDDYLLMPKTDTVTPVHTTEPVRAGDTSGVTPEFGRIADVQKLFGIKCGTTYNLLPLGKIKGTIVTRERTDNRRSPNLTCQRSSFLSRKTFRQLRID